MESLIKKNNTTLIRTPNSFIETFDKWREEEGRKNKVEVSRNMGFNLFREIMPYVSLDVKTKRKKKEINLSLK